jgi:peptidoglycan/LPS O-acetylase OafA/YrhL
MSTVKFFLYQFLLLTALLLVNIYSDPYISKPFSIVDLIATIIVFPVYFLLISMFVKLYRRFNTRSRNKIIVITLAFVAAIILLTLTENIWFEIKGEMLFK